MRELLRSLYSCIQSGSNTLSELGGGPCLDRSKIFQAVEGRFMALLTDRARPGLLDPIRSNLTDAFLALTP
ncbi:MAG: hypothetical protein AB7P09_08515 [Pyrinomonadaceae bacterium]